MFKYLLLGLVCFPSLLLAATDGEVVVEDHDKFKDVFYKFGGGVRLRQNMFQDSTAGAIPFEEDYQTTSHRAQVDLTLNKGEYFTTYFRALHTNVWGEDNTTSDAFIVNQAWGNWKVTEFLDLKFGRQQVEIGRGLVYGANEWENIPTSYDGFAALFDWDVLELSFFALKMNELERAPGVSVASDPENTHYIIDASFKELADIIQMAELSFAAINSDLGNIPGTTTLLNKQRVQRFGFDLVLSGVYFETSATVNYLAGEQTTLTAVDEKVKQLMMDGELKLMMPDWDQLAVWVGAHSDSGDDDPTDGSNAQYDPLNYNLHFNAGRMDFFKFGNLTFARAGASMRLLSDWYFGAEYFMFQKTKSGAPNFLEKGPLVSDIQSGVYAFGNDKDLGQEVDFWFGKTFPSGVTMELSINYLKPGKALENATLAATGAANTLDNSIYNLIFDLGFFF